MADGFINKRKISIFKIEGRRSIRLLSALISGKLMYFDIKYCLKSERGGCVIGEIDLIRT